MKIKLTSTLLAGLMALATVCPAQDKPAGREELIKLLKGLKYEQGEIALRGGLASLHVPKEFKFLGPKDAETVLVKLWGNPPSGGVLGLLLPADKTPVDPDCWAVTITFAEDGYVKDDDASKIDYAKLLKEMQAGVREASQERVKEGYPGVELIGWAAPPHYDAASHKLYWAKELKFSDAPEHTLNYNIRILGRRGVLVLNVISGMPQLAEIEQQNPQILAMVNFTEGNRYADFDGKVDKVATYGIAALVAGGIATKLGFFKMIWVFLLAAKKFIIIGVIALGAWLKKLFSNRNQTDA